MITISKKYKEEIKQVCSAASNKSHIQALENIYISASPDGIVILKAGDSLVEITRMIVADNFESGFTTTVNATKFIQSFNACSGDVDIIVKDDMVIKSGRRKFTLPTVSADAYPSYPEMDECKTIECDNFIEKIKTVAWASAQDDARYQLNGIYVGNHAVATNGHKMSMIKLDAETSIIIPIESIKKLPIIDSYTVSYSENVISIRTDDMEFKTKLVDANFPDYNRVIQSPNKYVTVNSVDFIDAVKASSVLADSKSKTVIFTFGGESKVESASGDKRESSSIGFDCDSEHDEFQFACNSSYLLDLLSSVSSDVLNIGFTDQQMIITQNDQTSLIMRVKI